MKEKVMMEDDGREYCGYSMIRSMISESKGWERRGEQGVTRDRRQATKR